MKLNPKFDGKYRRVEVYDEMENMPGTGVVVPVNHIYDAAFLDDEGKIFCVATNVPPAFVDNVWDYHARGTEQYFKTETGVIKYER